MRYPPIRTAVARNWRAMVLATCVSAAVVVALLSWPRPATSASSSSQTAEGLSLGYVPVSRPAPAFSLSQLMGDGTVRLSAFSGKPVVVNFWSSTCTVCKKETPAIAQVARAAGEKIAVIGVDAFDVRGAGQAFARSYKVPYQLAFDPQGSIADKYGVPALPETFFISKSGKRVIGLDLGALTAGHLTAILKKLYGVTV